MKPVDYMDDDDVPTKDDFSSHSIDEKFELRRSIKKKSRFWVFISWITAVLFAVIGTFYLFDHSYSIASFSIAVLCFGAALYWGYFGYIYFRILRASTAKEMLRHLDKLYFDPVFVGDEPPIRGLCFGAIAALSGILGVDYHFHWSVYLLVFIIIAFFIAVLIWSWRKHESGNFPQDGEIENTIEKLQDLEEE